MDRDQVMTARFVTIGHSNRPLDEFLDMLRAARIEMLIDVRKFPRSRTNPAYNIDSLPENLAHLQIGYRHWPAFGGRRSRLPGVDQSINALWRVQSFHNYADYALGREFAAAFEELVALSHAQRLALMCSEAVWWRCHRRIIADYLLLNGHAVSHAMTPGRLEEGVPTPGAERIAEGKVVYPLASDPLDDRE
jgi:uncharacterized protein (DUF488 family)